MSLLNSIGFTGHAHFFQFNGYFHPVEIAISDIYSDKGFGVLVEPPYFLSTLRDSDMNNQLSNSGHMIKFPPPKYGSLPLDQAEKYLKTNYLWLDRGRGQKLAVRGASQKRFFESLGFRTIDVERDLSSNLSNYQSPPPPEEEVNFNETFVFSNDADHRYRVHVSGDDSQCAGRLASDLANYIHKMKLYHFKDITCHSFLF